MDPKAPTAVPIRVAVVDDSSEDRERVVRALADTSNLLCAPACRSPAEALLLLPRVQPDVVLMDIRMPGGSGIDCVRQLRPLLPDTQFMMLTVFEDHASIFESITAGATGYLLKKASVPELIRAVQDLHSGQSPISGQIARKLIVELSKSLTQSRAPLSSPLSPSEQSVLQLLGRGLLYKEVADQLHISISTVRTHIHHIYRKLEVHNRTEALLKGMPGPCR